MGRQRPPPVNASNLNDISNTLEKLDNKDVFDENYKKGDVLITARTDLGDEWTLCNGDTVPMDAPLYEDLRKLWIPGEKWKDRGDISFTQSYFTDGTYLYYWTMNNGSIEVVKRNFKNVEQGRKTVVSAFAGQSVSVYFTLGPDATNLPIYTNGLYICYFVVGGKDTYLLYTDNLDADEYQYVLLHSETNMTNPYIFYENGQYVISVAENKSAATINMHIWYGTQLNSLTKKTITFQSKSTSIDPCEYVNYYNGNYYIFFRDYVSNNWKTYYIMSPTIDGFVQSKDHPLPSGFQIMSNTYVMRSPDGKYMYFYSGNSYRINYETMTEEMIWNSGGYVVYVQDWFILYRDKQNDFGCWNVTTGVGYRLKYITTSNTICSVVGENFDMLNLNNQQISVVSYPEITMTGAYAYIKTED